MNMPPEKYSQESPPLPKDRPETGPKNLEDLEVGAAVGVFTVLSVLPAELLFIFSALLYGLLFYLTLSDDERIRRLDVEFSTYLIMFVAATIIAFMGVDGHKKEKERERRIAWRIANHVTEKPPEHRPEGD
jgi:hypothetical protein